MAAIFTYGFPLAIKRFKDAGVELLTLSNYNAMLEAALDTQYIREEDLDTLKEWRKDPANWARALNPLPPHEDIMPFGSQSQTAL